MTRLRHHVRVRRDRNIPWGRHVAAAIVAATSIALLFGVTALPAAAATGVNPLPPVTAPAPGATCDGLLLPNGTCLNTPAGVFGAFGNTPTAALALLVLSTLIANSENDLASAASQAQALTAAKAALRAIWTELNLSEFLPLASSGP